MVVVLWEWIGIVIWCVCIGWFWWLVVVDWIDDVGIDWFVGVDFDVYCDGGVKIVWDWFFFEGKGLGIVCVEIGVY